MSALCLLATQCVAFDRRTGVAAETIGRRSLCPDCERVCHSDVALLRYDYVDLSQLIARREGHGDAKIARPKPRSQPPIDLDVDALRTEIAQALWTWEQPVRWAAGLPPRSTSPARDGWRVDNAVAVISPRVELLASLPEIGAYHDGRDAPMTWVDGLGGLTRLRELHRYARRHTGLIVANVGLPGECPKCAAHALYRRHGCDDVTCGNCRSAWEYAEYSRYVRLMIAQNPTADA